MVTANLIYTEYADQVADAYLLHGVDPTEKLADVARQETLNPEEIQRVAEKANQSIFAALRKEGGTDQTDEFDLADIHKVREILHPVKIGSSGFVARDVIAPPAPTVQPDQPWLPTNEQKIAYLGELHRIGVGLEAEERSEWMENANRVINEFVTETMKTASEEDLSLEDLRTILVNTRPKMASLIDDLLGLAAETHHRPFNKEAAPAPDHFFATSLSKGDGRPVHIVNGNHALVMHLDNMWNLDQRKNVSDVEQFLVKGVRNLTDRRTDIR